MKVKVIRPYTDKQLLKNMFVGIEFETTPERAKVLIDKDFVVAVDAVVEEVKPKQTRRRRNK